MEKKTIVIIAGTRPECIKMAPIYFALKASLKFKPIFLSSGQHREMLDQTLNAFGIVPDHDLNLMQPRQSPADFMARAICAMTEWFNKNRPDGILVQGDTTTVFAAAMSAFYSNIPIGHVEAGLRTGNMKSPWPEEMNRRLTAPLSEWHFCPTELARQNLVSEGIPKQRCYVTGNTVIDALHYIKLKQQERLLSVDALADRNKIDENFKNKFLKNNNSKWILVTGHRRESFGSGIDSICQAIIMLIQEFPNIGVLYPVHLNPQIQGPVRRILGSFPQICLVDPVGYEDFVWLLNQCTLVLTDSGGVQEEAPSLGKPVLIMRETTERQEGIIAGTCRLVGVDPNRILQAVKELVDDPTEYHRRSALKNPYGNGDAAIQITNILERHRF